MYPDERSLVSKLKDEPFALVGVNSDPAERYRSVVEKGEVTWPSFWDGGHTQGPIATKWAVWGWPTIYILDHEGIIRAKGLRGAQMEEEVKRLLQEMRGTVEGGGGGAEE